MKNIPPRKRKRNSSLMKKKKTPTHLQISAFIVLTAAAISIYINNLTLEHILNNQAFQTTLFLEVIVAYFLYIGLFEYKHISIFRAIRKFRNKRKRRSLIIKSFTTPLLVYRVSKNLIS